MKKKKIHKLRSQLKERRTQKRIKISHNLCIDITKDQMNKDKNIFNI